MVLLRMIGADFRSLRSLGIKYFVLGLVLGWAFSIQTWAIFSALSMATCVCITTKQPNLKLKTHPRQPLNSNFKVMLSVIIQNVVMLSVILHNVVMPSVMGPLNLLISTLLIIKNLLVIDEMASQDKTWAEFPNPDMGAYVCHSVDE